MSALATVSCGCTSKIERKPGDPVRVLIDREPSTLNPRRTLDANGQRLGSLLFASLTRMSATLEPVPALAESWRTEDSGRRWVFPIRKGQFDHSDGRIDAAKMTECLEEYRSGSPTSALATAFPNWKSTKARGNEVVIHLEKPDPYLARNISLLRYFRQKGRSPCREPSPSLPVITSGDYQVAGGLIDLTPERNLSLIPRGKGLTALEFLFVRDETTRALMLLRGDADASQNGLSLPKTAWFENKEGYRVLRAPGVSVSYLAFNLNDPLTSRLEVRRAIAAAIDREEATTRKYFGLAIPAQSFLSPLLPEAAAPEFPFELSDAARILEKAGFPAGPDGVRIRLAYKTTTSSIGIEQAMMLKGMLARAGIELNLQVVEPAVFFSSVTAGSFQLYTSRWVGVADGSILYTSLRSGQPRNRVRYSNPRIDEWLDQGTAEPDLDKRRALLRKVQQAMIEDLPYFPLWYWKNTLILRSERPGKSGDSVATSRSLRLTGLEVNELSLSGAFDPLSKLRLEAQSP